MRDGVLDGEDAVSEALGGVSAEAVRLVREAQAPLAQIARELGVKESTLRLWSRRPGPTRPCR